MLNLTRMTKQERKEAAKIQLRRIREEERKKRIFNPRTRIIGVDANALQEQVEENRKKLEEEKKLNDYFIQYLRDADRLAIEMGEQEKLARMKIEQQINNFRKEYQKPETRREYDLNDPNFLKKQLPARISDDDPRLGPSSAQIFVGENLLEKQRLLVQKEQTKAYLEQQMKERRMAEEQRKLSEEMYGNAVACKDKKAQELADLEQELRRKLYCATQKFNQALSQEQRAQSAKKEKEKMDEELLEITSLMNSDLLTENPEIAQSNLGPFRKIPYLYKGMTEEEIAEYRKYQVEQIEEKKRLKDEEKDLEKRFYDYFDEMHRKVKEIDDELEENRKKFAKTLEEQNLKLAKEQKDNNDLFNRYGLTNVPNELYFNQFNQSTR